MTEAARRVKPAEAVKPAKPATKKHYLAGHYGSGASKHLVSAFRYRCYSADKHIMTREERNLNIAINLAWAAVKIPIYAAGGLLAGFVAGNVLGYLIAATTAIPFEPVLAAATWGGALLGAAKYLWDCEPIPKLKELLTEPRICVGGAEDVFKFNPFHRRKQPEGEK